jgi:2,4-dienoyl-CoA reductase-like NADH-dependent reductase (Old Yellow Enzyme family)
MKTLFDETDLSGIRLKNRFIRAATWENMADGQGHVTDRLMKIYEDLSKGGVGLMITGFAFVIKDEQPRPGMMGIYHDSFIEEYRQLTKMVHDIGCKIILQVAYGGSNTYYNVGEREIWGPSEVPHEVHGVTPKEMTKEDIKTLINAYADAVERAKSSGFDGVEYHAAHGYLLSQFLSPYYNKRTDEYGGSIENRARIIYEICDETRGRVGKDYPLFIKIHCSDFMEQGFSFEETKLVCNELGEKGIDAIEISGGNFSNPEVSPVRTKIDTPEKESYFHEYASEIAKEIDVPVILVGGNKSFEVMEEILLHSEIDYFSLSRPLLCEPDLINKWKRGAQAKVRCLSCNKCWNEGGNVCIQNRKTGEK